MRIGRGDVWIIDLGGYFGKIRPCFVLSQAPEDVDRDPRAVAPFTTQPRQSRFEVILDVTSLARGVRAVVDVQNLMTTTPSKFLKRLGRLIPEQMDELGQAVRVWLGL